jgi:hypothetical protein
MMLRFAFAIVLAMYAWPGVLLADQLALPHYHTDFEILRNDSYMISGRPQDRNDQSELTATKGDIDALNKRLDGIERMIRCIVTDPKACY